jgi:hypothetical protein
MCAHYHTYSFLTGPYVRLQICYPVSRYIDVQLLRSRTFSYRSAIPKTLKTDPIISSNT